MQGQGRLVRGSGRPCVSLVGCRIRGEDEMYDPSMRERNGMRDVTGMNECVGVMLVLERE